MHSLTFVALEQRGSYRSARFAQEWQKDLGGPEMEAIGDNIYELGSQKTETLAQLEGEEILGANEEGRMAPAGKSCWCQRESCELAEHQVGAPFPPPY